MTKQGFKKDEHEVLVINDGSTDNSESVIDEFCSRYDYFVKVNKENGGVSSARNLGLDLAKGDYIAFIDGDDMFAENGYLPMLEICYKENLDAFYFGYTRDKNEFIEAKKRSLRFQNVSIENQRGASSAWVLLMRRSIIENNSLRFNPRVYYMEDGLFCFYFVENTTKIAYANEVLYFYRPNPQSATSVWQHNSKTYGNLTTKEYKCYTSVLIFCSEIKKYRQIHNCKNSEYSLSAGVLKILWNSMLYKYKPKTTFKDMEEYGLSLKDLTIKNIEGHSFKMRLKSEIQYRFRYKWFYRLICWMYRLFVH